MNEHTEQKTQLNAGEAANLAHTSLATQIGHILQCRTVRPRPPSAALRAC